MVLHPDASCWKLLACQELRCSCCTPSTDHPFHRDCQKLRELAGDAESWEVQMRNGLNRGENQEDGVLDLLITWSLKYKFGCLPFYETNLPIHANVVDVSCSLRSLIRKAYEARE